MCCGGSDLSRVQNLLVLMLGVSPLTGCLVLSFSPVSCEAPVRWRSALPGLPAIMSPTPMEKSNQRPRPPRQGAKVNLSSLKYFCQVFVVVVVVVVLFCFVLFYQRY